jgi:hypothetical protein
MSMVTLTFCIRKPFCSYHASQTCIGEVNVFGSCYLSFPFWLMWQLTCSYWSMYTILNWYEQIRKTLLVDASKHQIGVFGDRKHR